MGHVVRNGAEGVFQLESRAVNRLQRAIVQLSADPLSFLSNGKIAPALLQATTHFNFKYFKTSNDKISDQDPRDSARDRRWEAEAGRQELSINQRRREKRSRRYQKSGD